MTDSIRIIHLSDLHINPLDSSESAPVYNRLCDKIKKIREHHRYDVDLLIVSGDLVCNGAGDYGIVEKIIDDIISAAGISREFVFFVPGNHDVVRNECSSYIYDGVISKLKRAPREEFTGLDRDAKKVFFPGFSKFTDFSLNYPLHQNSIFDLPGFVCKDMEISGVPIRLCGVNSALVAGPNDQNKSDDQLRDRVVGRQLLWKMLDCRDRLILVVSHYPLSWIHVDEREEITQRLQQSNVIFFHGHTHVPRVDGIGVTKNHSLLSLGVGSLYGEKWLGRNHCQLLELSSKHDSPLLHEMFWSGEYGWRGVEPLEIQWGGWDALRCKLGPSSPPQDHEAGLVSIGKGRNDSERMGYYGKALELAAEGSDLLFLGRSLIDLSLLNSSMARSIKEKKLHIKIGILDENTIPDKKSLPDGTKNCSWIEKPIPSDWAIDDVPNSMERFRKIKIDPGTGSLEIYGLPFYLPHSFIAFTNKYDGNRYCLEETGMALDKGQRPFIELKSISDDSYASSVESLYRLMMIPERLLIFDNGQRNERDTTQRAKIIAPKAEKVGLVDISVGRNDIDWFASSISQRILDTPEEGEIFIVGRSIVSWANYYNELADAIIEKKIKCIFVIADPTISGLKSLTLNDYAETDLPVCWHHFRENLYPLLMKRKKQNSGTFELYGIPAFIPETFASYTGTDRIRFCSLEPGIGVGPDDRPILYFKQVSEKDVYTKLNKIYRGILNGRQPLLKFPN